MTGLNVCTECIKFGQIFFLCFYWHGKVSNFYRPIWKKNDTFTKKFGSTFLPPISPGTSRCNNIKKIDIYNFSFILDRNLFIINRLMIWYQNDIISYKSIKSVLSHMFAVYFYVFYSVQNYKKTIMMLYIKTMNNSF